ncbi:MAG: hypothetical protein ACRBM6_03510 [Geminicoccales bacterium]
MSASQAKMVEYAIIGLCVVALLLIFQPVALPLYSIGAGLVVLGGLAFNLIPFCREGVPARQLVKVGLVILIVLAIAMALGIGTGYLYVWYLELQRG